MICKKNQQDIKEIARKANEITEKIYRKEFKEFLKEIRETNGENIALKTFETFHDISLIVEGLLPCERIMMFSALLTMSVDLCPIFLDDESKAECSYHRPEDNTKRFSFEASD